MEVADVERWVQALVPLGVADLGGSKFTSQHSRIEQLNLLAHTAATSNSDNFVLSSLLTHEKLPVILHLLLATEAWREQVLPEILNSLAAFVEPPERGGQGRGGHGSCMRAYFILHHESVLCNLLEVLLFHDYAAEALGDGLIDLVDYCCRQVSSLIFHQQKAKVRLEQKQRGLSSISSSLLLLSSSSSITATTASSRQLSAEEILEIEEAEEDEESGFGGGGPMDSKAAAQLLERDAADPARAARRQLRCWRARIGVHAAVTSVTMLRYLSEYCVRLPLGVISRLMETHDVASLVVPLIENPPWVRRITRPAPNNIINTSPTQNEVTDSSSNAAALVTTRPTQKPLASTTVWQKYIDHKWVDVEPRDLLKLTRLEAQPWLTMHALLLEPELRKKYPYDGSRRSQTSRARKFINEILLDQLPILSDLQRFMDESTIRGVESAPEQRGGLLLEAIPAVHDEVQREALTARDDVDEELDTHKSSSFSSSSSSSSAADSTLLTIEREKLVSSIKMRRTWTWSRLGRFMLRNSLRSRIKPGTKIEPKSFPSSAFSDVWPESDGDEDLKQLAGVYNEDTFEAATLGDPMCALCGKPAEKRCAKCHNEWYCSRECQVSSWKGHKELCAIVAKDLAKQVQLEV
jgi:zinc finger MYND domain-containing protein 10